MAHAVGLLGGALALLRAADGPSECASARQGARVLRARRGLWLLYWTSCFAYSAVGAALWVLAPALPRKYHDAAPMDLQLYACLLLLQGPVAFGNDVYTKFLAAPVLASGYRHPLALLDMACASVGTCVLLSLCLAPQDGAQAAIAALCVLWGAGSYAMQARHYGRSWAQFAVWKVHWHVSFPLCSYLWLLYTTSI